MTKAVKSSSRNQNVAREKLKIATPGMVTGMEPKHRDIIFTLFGKSDVNARVQVLERLVLDLFMEIQALRQSVIQIDERALGAKVSGNGEVGYQGQILAWGKSAYQKAYLETAYLTHDNGGPSGGLDKLLSEFYPAATDDMGRTWRECLFLERLGFSPAEIAAYKKAAEEAEMFT